MARRKSSEAQPPPKEWTLAEIDKGIEKLKRRVIDVQALDSEQVNYDNAKVASVESDIARTVEEVFGTGSRENKEHNYVRISRGDNRRPGFRENPSIIYARRQRAFKAGIPDTVTMLEGLIRRLEEKREGLFPSSSGRLTMQAESASVQSIEQRLARLAELKSKDLISEQEYASRREKILDEI